MSFRVICIDGVKTGDSGSLGNRKADLCDEIYEGEEYTVVKEVTINNHRSYSLAERRSISVYRASRFVPLSSIDETEYSTIKEKESV